MLQEDKRQQLDQIVQRMVEAQEPDSNISFVVEDFKKKYDQPEVPLIQKPAQRNMLQKTAGFLGVEKFAQGLSTIGSSAPRVANEINMRDDQSKQLLLRAIRAETDPVKEERLLESYQKIWGNSEPVTAGQINPGFDLSKREVIGSAGNVVLNAATPGTFGGGLGANVAKSAALGGGFGLAGGLNDKARDTADLVKSILGGAAIGGAIPVAGRVLGKVKNFATNTLPERIYNRAIKPTLDELRKNVKFGKDTLGKELLQEGVKGSPQKLLTIADTNLSRYEERLQAILKSSKATVKRSDLFKYLDNIKANAEATPGLGSEVEKIQAIVNEFPLEVPIAKANQIKRNLYNELRNVGYKLDANLSTKREAMKALASGIKQEIEKKSENPRLIKSINSKLSIYGRLEDRIVDVVARNSRNNLFGLTDAILTGGGLAAGSPLGFFAAVGKHIAGSTRAQTNVAVGLNKLKNVGTGKVVSFAKGVIRRGVLNMP